MKVRKLLLAAAGIGAAAVLAAGDDPLMKANAYTLELDSALKPAGTFFPLGILFDTQFETLPRIGFTFTDGAGHCCYEYAKGVPCKYHTKMNGRAPLFVSLWAAHTVANSRKTATHGELRNSIGSDGRPHSRHNLDLNDPNTRQYVLDCQKFSVEKVMEVNGDHVFMWHLDNEWELPLNYSPLSKAAFVKYLEKEYGGDLEKLNRAWESGYKTFSEAVPPVPGESSARPGAWLDWHRFHGEVYTDFMAERFRNVSEADNGRRRVVFKGTQVMLEMPAVARVRVNNHEMMAEKTRGWSKGWYGIDVYGNGDRNNYEFNYLYNCIRPADPEDRTFNYGVFAAETNNHTGPGWQFAQSFWRTLAAGLKGYDFFTMGSKGAKGDWATFGFTRSADGTRHGKFYYASRLASMIHRSEKFWAESRPCTKGAVAMLLPQRDVLLSEPCGASRWDYPANNRLKVYSALRSAGYRVEVLPYGKLTDRYLRDFAALVLVGADHLSARECEAAAAFVKNGGVLVADGQSGFFDEHHIVNRGLEKVLGIEMGKVYKGIDVSPDDLWLRTAGDDIIRFDGKVLGKAAGAEVLNPDDQVNSLKVPMLTRNSFGRGTAFWINTRLGTMRAESGPDSVESDWIRTLLSSAGVKPQSEAPSPRLRVETPYIDGRGNAVTIVANTWRQPVPAQSVRIQLPEEGYAAAYWADAESTLLKPLPVRPLGKGWYEFELPELRTAGAVYTMKDPAPMLGLAVMNAERSADADRWTTSLEKGKSYQVKVQSAYADKGTVQLRAFGDWQVTPEAQPVRPSKPGELSEYLFTVTLPEESALFQPNQPCPLLAQITQDGRRTAVCNAAVAIH